MHDIVLYPLCSTVLMLKPNVGEMVLMSSPMNFFSIVVLPALSKPLDGSCQGHASSHLANRYVHRSTRHQITTVTTSTVSRIQHENPDILFLLFHLLQNRQQTHLLGSPNLVLSLFYLKPTNKSRDFTRLDGSIELPRVSLPPAHQDQLCPAGGWRGERGERP